MEDLTPLTLAILTADGSRGGALLYITKNAAEKIEDLHEAITLMRSLEENPTTELFVQMRMGRLTVYEQLEYEILKKDVETYDEEFKKIGPKIFYENALAVIKATPIQEHIEMFKASCDPENNEAYPLAIRIADMDRMLQTYVVKDFKEGDRIEKDVALEKFNALPDQIAAMQQSVDAVVERIEKFIAKQDSTEG